jgi:hypothetical protein
MRVAADGEWTFTGVLGGLLLLMLSRGEKCPAEPAVGALRVNLTHNVVVVNRK